MPARAEVTHRPSELEEAGVVRFHLRGREVEIREVPGEDYEEAMRTAEAASETPGKIDMPTLEKLLCFGAVKIDGQEVDPEQWGGKGSDRWFTYPVTSRIADEVKRLHWVTLETDEEIAERKAEEAKAAKATEASTKKGVELPNS